MENIKSYKKFILNEGIIDDLLGSDTKPVQELNTSSLMGMLAKKISGREDGPIYIYNQVDVDGKFYVSVELFDEASKMGYTQEPDGSILTGNGKYSYSVLDCSLVESFNADEIKSGLLQIVKNNSSKGAKTIIEFANLSSLEKDQISSIGEMISDRTGLNEGDFFILSDNSKMGQDLSQSISDFLPKIEIEKYRHILSQNNENPA